MSRLAGASAQGRPSPPGPTRPARGRLQGQAPGWAGGEQVDGAEGPQAPQPPEQLFPRCPIRSEAEAGMVASSLSKTLSCVFIEKENHQQTSSVCPV